MYVQSGVQRIEVYVHRDADAPESGNSLDPSETHNSNKSLASKRRLKRIIVTNTTHAIAVAKQVGNIYFNYQVGGVAMKHGDEDLQDQVRRTIEKISDPLSIASSIAMGGVYGAWGGPIGSVIGATLGAISSSASVGFKYLSREREYGFKLFKENNAIEYKRARANINLTTGRLR